MSELENAIIFESKRSRKREEEISDDIYFSVFKNKKGYLTLKIQIGFNIARKAKINEKTKLKFGCDREDKTIWYLIAGDEGYAISKARNGASYVSSIRWPFEFINKKNIKIEKNNIEINSDKRIITLFVFDYIDKSELILRDQ
ncbi:hypothetical protein SDA22_11575 [Legionella pneumophila serogroup 1]|uniref:Uncharacterized protein n=1 Tax=Legionella pneumophila TaxID=446 RepID=A0AAN5KT16_LEGPN|nr:hypothetical protein [Legionella pneumophila]HAT9012161.1 hypothetical protein [Legionella pneumophila subsp. pneumophila]QIB24677.1 hypothetical protein GCO85_09830 [Legionella pneumophila]CZH24547.1 Uncharacterised protein [Legionella pneumophila]HAT1597285.1 hypothetical protein [Legionella pneumophila]HAT2073260.1 hypothetical protein [Legionella pneumophila]